MIILAGLERGLDYAAIRNMQIGEIVDFCIEYNERQEPKPKTRKASQADIDAFFRG